MKICGFNKTTLLDYPEHVASTIFLGGCNLRCPFCQNGGLVLRPGEQPEYDREEILKFLKKRKGILDGVCVTGGEPTLANDLRDFILQLKELGYPVKLDTNGTRPEVLKDLLERNLLDYVAMDIKTSPANYTVLTGGVDCVEAVKESVEMLMKGSVPYEFRTTVVKELHSRSDFEEIGTWLEGAERYFLQAYKDSEEVLQPGFSGYTAEELQAFAELLRKNIKYVGIRGIDL
ncbi:MAG: anaerobic ribonucleoside-triphosphate reductase activating protein [Eubacteriales bacterium]|nr:anaerobic ribonucleoside-triphosphate reductase activating protein [Eubacteriales bacterium]